MTANYDRLLQLAEFLDKLPPRLFNFGILFRVGDREPLDAFEVGGGCGTAGCTIGWTPKVFPDLVEWDGNMVIMRSRTPGDAGVGMTVGQRLFDLTNQQNTRLFYPGAADQGYSVLPDHASAKEVAEHIRRWVGRSRRRGEANRQRRKEVAA